MGGCGEGFQGLPDGRSFATEADTNLGIEGTNGIDQITVKIDALESGVTELAV